MLCLLRDMRIAAGLSQEDVALRLKVTQSFVSKCERGQRRMDFVELRQWCLVLGIDTVNFSTYFEDLAAARNLVLGSPPSGT